MRILIYNWKDLSHPSAGGAEVFTHRVAEEWVKQGHDVTLFCSAVEGRPALEAVAGVQIVRRGGRLSVYREARRYWRYEGRAQFDLVVDEVNTRPFLTPQYVKDVPVVALIHQVCREIWWHETPFPIALLGRFWLEPRWLRLYRDVPVLTLSGSSRASLTEYGLRDVRLIPVGIDSHNRPNVSREGLPTVVFVGRLSKNKRPDEALCAFAILQRQVPQARMWIIGDGPIRTRLERLQIPNVEFLGRISDERKRELMARAHVLVATSVREGWGLVVDEAAHMGTPSIGYDVAGLRDSLSAAGGVLVEPRPAALAEALARFFRGHPSRPTSGGAHPWAFVADEVLRMSTDRENVAPT